MKKLINSIYAVEIPQDAKEVKLNIYRTMILYDSEIENREEAPFPSGIHLNPGNYTLIGISDEMSEEQWKEIVSRNENIYNVWYRDYCFKSGTKKPNTPFQFTNAVESGQSLLKSKGLNKRYAILKLNGNGK